MDTARFTALAHVYSGVASRRDIAQRLAADLGLTAVTRPGIGEAGQAQEETPQGLQVMWSLLALPKGATQSAIR